MPACEQIVPSVNCFADPIFKGDNCSFCCYTPGSPAAVTCTCILCTLSKQGMCYHTLLGSSYHC
jgi:hypothetical protein